MPSAVLFETVEVVSLRPFARNARHHSSAQVKAIATSIRKFGFTNPILVDEFGEIIAGHGRYEAALLIRLTIVPIIRIEGLTDTQKRALRLADNKLSLRSSWDVELLSAELADLTMTDLDITLTGFEAIEVDRLTTPSLENIEVDDPLPDPPSAPVSSSGDLWLLGSHRLAVGDARDPETYRRLLGWKIADMIMTDPPYNVRISGNVSGKGRKKHTDFLMASGEMSKRGFVEFLTNVLTLARDASRDGALHYIFADWRMIGTLTSVGEALFSDLLNIAIWVKSNGGLGSFYRSQHEMVAIFKHGTGRHVNNVELGRMGRYRSNIWQYPGASGFSKTRKKDLERHPTVKPVALVADAIRDATKPGDLVLDPFGGSGTTLIAAELTKRRAALIEIEPKYADVTLQRFQQQTGIEPVLLPDRTPLSTVCSHRNVNLEDRSS